MTHQPPPPPPPASGGSSAFDPKSVNTFDWALMGIGALLFIFSLFSYWTAPDYCYLGHCVSSDASASAWHFDYGTWAGWFAFILGLAAAVVVALRVFVPSLKLPVPNYVAALGLFAASLLFYIIGFFSSDLDNGFSYWLSLILVIAGAVLSLIRAQQTNTALPGPLAGLPKIIK